VSPPPEGTPARERAARQGAEQHAGVSLGIRSELGGVGLKLHSSPSVSSKGPAVHLDLWVESREVWGTLVH
jgi:hypothetical protein